MITQVFPDEFHLNTLDQLLSAIARLNPHVNIKAVVIGLMDRLSSYAAREAELESPEDRKQTEEEATTELLKKLRITKDNEKPQAKPDGIEGKQTNGEQRNGDKPTEPPSNEVEDRAGKSSKQSATSEDGDKQETSKKRGIPEDVKLYTIFYEQVVNLVNAQRLPVQDTIALLVSLSKLAL